jgi:hypothetical protein
MGGGYPRRPIEALGSPPCSGVTGSGLLPASSPPHPKAPSARPTSKIPRRGSKGGLRCASDPPAVHLLLIHPARVVAGPGHLGRGHRLRDAGQAGRHGGPSLRTQTTGVPSISGTGGQRPTLSRHRGRRRDRRGATSLRQPHALYGPVDAPSALILPGCGW